MTRPDLIALTPDDLATLANRGLVKRAQKEIETGEHQAQWTESEDGTIVAAWPDGATCTLPGGKTLKDATCTCAALDLCRHILRTVLAWQAKQIAGATEGNAAPPPPEPWDPGRIADELLEAQVPKRVRDRANVLWNQGILVELIRAVKPSARFHSPGHTVRFPVPDDLRYVQCSCSDPAPCAHAVLAVMAFRKLAPEETSGIINEGTQDRPVDAAPLHEAQACLRELIGDGFASSSTAWRDRTRRAAAQCQQAALTWPAQLLEELADDLDLYTARDAAFHPSQALARAGELLLRADAILAGRAPVPQAFIRGLKSDKDTDLGAARFVGLGAAAHEGRASSTVTVFMQDIETGHAVTVYKDFNEDLEKGEIRQPFEVLGKRSSGVKDANFLQLARGQLVSRGGKRTAAGKLQISRAARSMVNPQSFRWEELKAPLLVEDFEEIIARLRLLPPASFRPRRAAGDFHVCPITAIRSSAFDPVHQAVVAMLEDAAGNRAWLWHPWTTRGGPGAEALLRSLGPETKPLFVAGHVRQAGTGLVIRPTALVVAEEGGARRAILPWLDGATADTPEEAGESRGIGRQERSSRYAAATELAVDLILQGARRASSRGWTGWARAAQETEELGYHRMAELLRAVPQSTDAVGAMAVMLKVLSLEADLG